MKDIEFEDKMVLMSKSHFFTMYILAYGGDKEEVQHYLNDAPGSIPREIDKEDIIRRKTLL